VLGVLPGTRLVQAVEAVKLLLGKASRWWAAVALRRREQKSREVRYARDPSARRAGSPDADSCRSTRRRAAHCAPANDCSGRRARRHATATASAPLEARLTSWRFAPKC